MPVALDPTAIAQKQALQERKRFRAIQAAVARANAPGREERIAAAQAKRDRRQAKRASDATMMWVGEL
jgi:hypothetical protein